MKFSAKPYFEFSFKQLCVSMSDLKIFAVALVFAFTFVTFVGVVKAEASLSNQEKVCSEIFSNLEQQLHFEIGLHALAKKAARVILENTGRPHDMQRDILLGKINEEARAHIKTKEQKQRYGELILDYQKELRVEIDQKRRVQIEKENKREEILKEQVKEIKERNHPVNVIAKAKILFNEITPGSFEMNYAFKDSVVRLIKTDLITLTKPYALAQYQTTQMQWAYLKILMGEKNPKKIIPSKYKEGPNSVEVDFELKNGDILKFNMQPDNPVDSVSWIQVKDWINGLNDLSINGDELTQKELQRVIPGHIKGDLYSLPTESQWAFVMQNRGKNNHVHFDRDDESDVGNFAVYDKNSGIGTGSYEGTYEVGSKLSRKIDSGDGTIVDFSDLEGNVWELMNDIYIQHPSSGKDPQGGTLGTSYVIRGGSWKNNIRSLSTFYRTTDSADRVSPSTGFRLVRTRP